MGTDNSIDKYVLEIHELRVALYLLLYIRAEDTKNLQFDLPVTDMDELSADWDDLASSLARRYWLAGCRAMTHVSGLGVPTEKFSQDSKTLLNRLYRGYSAMKCTNYFTPRMKSSRLLKNGIEHINKEFERSATPRFQKQNPQCDKGEKEAMSRNAQAWESQTIGTLQ